MNPNYQYKVFLHLEILIFLLLLLVSFLCVVCFFVSLFLNYLLDLFLVLPECFASLTSGFYFNFTLRGLSCFCCNPLMGNPFNYFFPHFFKFLVGKNLP